MILKEIFKKKLNILKLFFSRVPLLNWEFPYFPFFGDLPEAPPKKPEIANEPVSITNSTRKIVGKIKKNKEKARKCKEK